MIESGTWTVLFTDIVGSTELRTRLGDDEADIVFGAIDAAVGEAIDAHQGVLVKGLGDGHMAAFRGAADAIGAAVAIQQGIAREGQVVLRVGISAGDARAEGNDLFGTPVVEAARLCGASEGGQILVAALVRLLAGTRGGYEFESIGPLDLKGLSDPVEACVVRWEPVVSESHLHALPLPPALAAADQFAFVGRDEPLAQLTAAWRAVNAPDAHARAVLVAGEPGIGKTRLSAQLARQVHHDGGVVLLGRCEEELGVPYQPLVEALRFTIDHVEAEALPSMLGRNRGELARLLPDITTLVPDLPPATRSDPETERYRLFDAVAGWLSAMSAERPVLLIVDDLHWAGRPTLLLLRHIVTSLTPVRVLIVGTYRDTDLQRGDALADMLADFRRVEGVERVSLHGLTTEDVVDFFEWTTGQKPGRPGRDLARVVRDETEGNPFFIGEVLRHLTETGVLVQTDGRWDTAVPADRIGLPEGVREVVGRRLGRLSPEANEVLRVAAVIGREFDLEVLAPASGVAEDDVLRALGTAVQVRLIDEVAIDRWRFSHALVRSTLYDELGTSRRVRLHRAVAHILEERRPDDVSALARHFGEAAVSGVSEQAVHFALAAGDRSRAQLANDEAVTFYASALDLLEDGDQRRATVLARLGDAQRRAGDPAYRDTLLTAARLAHDAGDAETEVAAVLWTSRGFFSAAGRRDDGRVAAIRGALESIGEADSCDRAILLSTLGAELLFTDEIAQSHRLLREAVDMARRLGDDKVLAQTLNFFTASQADLFDLEGMLAMGRESLELAELVGDPALATMAASGLHVLACRAGDREAADAALARQIEHTERARQPMLEFVLANALAFRTLGEGRLDEGERLAEDMLQVGTESGQPDTLVWMSAHLCALWEEGRRGEEADALFTAAASVLPTANAILIRVLAELGETDRARDLWQQATAEGLPAIPTDLLWASGITSLAAAAWLLDDATHAAELRQQLVRLSGEIVCSGASFFGATDHYLGLLAALEGDFDQAEGHFAAAEQLEVAMDHVPRVCRTLLAWADVIVRRAPSDDAARARALQLVTRALAMADERGLPVRAERARAHLATLEAR